MNKNIINYNFNMHNNIFGMRLNISDIQENVIHVFNQSNICIKIIIFFSQHTLYYLCISLIVFMHKWLYNNE